VLLFQVFCVCWLIYAHPYMGLQPATRQSRVYCVSEYTASAAG